MAIDLALLSTLHGRANANRWQVSPAAFAVALEASAAKAFAGRAPDTTELGRYLSGLHLADLALACACAAGHDGAWQHFVLTYRPTLYRAVDAMDPTGGSRDLADSLYADLFGLGSAGGEQRSLFRYFHGRSSLATWLRAVLSQRHVDRVRERKHAEPIPSDDSTDALRAASFEPDPAYTGYVALMHAALATAMAMLATKDRLRLACYYAQRMTLAQTGRLLGEHEATVSRQLGRARVAIRESVEHQLRTEHHLPDAAIAECFTAVARDTGPLDLGELLGATENASVRPSRKPGKEFALDRSIKGRTP